MAEAALERRSPLHGWHRLLSDYIDTVVYTVYIHTVYYTYYGGQYSSMNGGDSTTYCRGYTGMTEVPLYVHRRVLGNLAAHSFAMGILPAGSIGARRFATEIFAVGSLAARQFSRGKFCRTTVLSRGILPLYFFLYL